MGAEKKVPPTAAATAVRGEEKDTGQGINPHGAGDRDRTGDPELGKARAGAESGPEPHRGAVGRTPVIGTWRAHCSCGWALGPFMSEPSATGHMLQHVRESNRTAGSSSPVTHVTLWCRRTGVLINAPPAPDHAPDVPPASSERSPHVPPLSPELAPGSHAAAVQRITELLAAVPGDTTEGKLRHLVQRAALVEELHHRAQAAELQRVNALQELERERRELARVRGDLVETIEQRDIARAAALGSKGGAA